MNVVSALLQLAIPVAELLKEKEGHKYLDELLAIDKELRNEEIKETPDDGRIGYLHIELMRVSAILGNSIKSKTT